MEENVRVGGEWKPLLIIISITALTGIVLQFFINASSSDYWIEKAFVKFNNTTGTIRESFLFHINKDGFHEYYKEYTGDEAVLTIACSKGLDRIDTYEHIHHKEVEMLICRSKAGLKKGNYWLNITYRMPNKEKIRWVSFTNSPRDIKHFWSNGDAIFNNVHRDEAAISYYPQADIGDILFRYFLRISTYRDIIVTILLVASMLIIYWRYGREAAVDEASLPEIVHTPPSHRPSYEVACLMADIPLGRSRDDVARFLSALIVNGIRKGTMEIKDKKLNIKDMKAVEEAYPKEITAILKMLNGRDLSKLNKKDIEKLVNTLMKNYLKTLEKYYSNKGFEEFFIPIGYILLLGGPILAVLLRIVPLPIWLIEWIFTVYFQLLVITGAYARFGKYLLGRYKTKEIYKERLLWDKFKKLLKDQSRLKEYSLKDMNMWGEWLEYAYALEIPKKNIELIAKMAKSMGYEKANEIATVSLYTLALSGAIKSISSSKRSSLGGGFSGGGSFGAR